MMPRWPSPSSAVTKFFMLPELFVMPTPLIVSSNPGLMFIVKALAPALNTMPLTSVLAERETAVRLLVANVAVSDGPLGTVIGFFLAAVAPSQIATLPCHHD